MKRIFAGVVGSVTLVLAQGQTATTGNVMSVPKTAANAGAVVNFVAADAIDYATVVPTPPAAGSLAASVDLAAVRQVQVWRTEEQVAWAKVVEKDAVFNHASVLGPWFVAERLPRTAELFKRLGDDMRAIDGASKKPFLRPRPPTVDAGVKPCVALPTSTGYPSGSAMQAWVWATLLAEAVPARREALMERAERAAWGRVIGGVHFPSDVVAGKLLAEAVLAVARKSPEFRASWAAARAEIAAAGHGEGGK